MDFNFFDWRDLIVIFIIIFITNLLKYVIKIKHIYIYLPFFLSIVIFVITFLLKNYELKESLFIVFKWYAGAIILYETILEKIQKVWDLYEESKNEKDN